ncbi:unnamed protein product [Adineta steineri]|uniref:Uncharacterized protein n=1 Tax=Adineta steineri TaxID=433720 RepID=A0A814SLR9_9BILA|nr:unnamed protein product [Adineta steineri]CAF1147684.1 unnamed protein product [Adineta steineri]CAF1155985.1 unnamed protein product [Adineta steineri]CAF1429991.1 unnamed protein product [Adineta steineri]CAF3938772.1 unnamed protein product [Adineta steineri]
MKLTESFYYEETRGLCGRKLLREIGEQGQTKIHLYAYESWPKPALTSCWTIKTVWWSKTKCHIIEQQGHRTSITKGHMKCLGNGRLEITGQFQRHTDAVFRLVLSSQITADDVSDGYILSGDLELGDTNDSMQQSHFAVVKLEQQQQQNHSINTMNNYFIKARSILLFGCV